MPLGGFRLNSLGKSASVAGPPPNTWTSYTLVNATTGNARYRGGTSMAFHGVQNGPYLVFTHNRALSTTPYTNYVHAGVINLETGEVVVDSGTAIGNNTNNTVNQCYVDGEGNQGMVTARTFRNSSYGLYLRPYNFTNWGSISTSNPPVLSFGTSFTKTTSNAGVFPSCFCNYTSTGDALYAVSQRDSIGDLSLLQVWRRNGMNAPSLYNSGTAGGNRNAGLPIAVKNGISANNWATVRSEGGNNGNTVQSWMEHGNASSKQKTQLNELGSGSGRSFSCFLIKDLNGTAFWIQRVNFSQDNLTRTNIVKWTNPNVPTQAASYTTAVSQNGTYQTDVGYVRVPYRDNTLGISYGVASTGTSMGLVEIQLNETALTETVITDLNNIPETNVPTSGDRYYFSYYHPTYGQWYWVNRYASGNVTYYINKWNP